MTSLFSVKDKTVVITGGSGYLGSEWCRVFEEEGADVSNWDLETGVDVTNLDDLRHAAAKLDHIDILICGAALNAPFNHPYEEYPSASFRIEIETNIVGTQNTIQLVVPSMRTWGSGSIILISSELALIGPNNYLYPSEQFKDIAYITSKAGILGLMRAWASHLGPYSVRVNALCPGGIEKDQDPQFVIDYGELNMLNRMAHKTEMNGPLLFLASDASSFMTGATLVVDGGRTAW